jgi:hypothetical protein
MLSESIARRSDSDESPEVFATSILERYDAIARAFVLRSVYDGMSSSAGRACEDSREDKSYNPETE